MSCDALIVAAFYPELAPLRDMLGDDAEEGLRGLLGEVDVAARVVGIGLPAAAVGAAMSIAKTLPRAVVAIGTCGAYPGAGLSIGDVVVATSVQLVDPSAVDGRSQFPGQMSLTSEPDPPMALALERAGARRARLATTVAITVDDVTAARIAQATGAEAEHLEAHGVATACAAHGVPFGAVFGVANSVGCNGRDEWRDHHLRAAAAAAHVVLRWLRGGALR